MASQEQKVNIQDEAKGLVAHLAANYDEKYGVGTMSCAIYDTAWIAMIKKTVGNETKWLFPESFDHLLREQQEDGGWKSYAAQVDGILNTLAGILALKRHASNPESSATALVAEDLEARIQKATAYVTGLLNTWDVAATTHVGFEILVPALLRYLSEEGITLDFAGKPLLTFIHGKKMSRFHPSLLYSPMKLSAVHSLEAFVGQIDFDKVVHHKAFGSMMASPSSTAAYLMHASKWDDDSEEYLRHVLEHGDGKGSGGVPSAFPSTYFEYTWVACTLMKGGFSKEDLGLENLDKVAAVLQAALDSERGVIGFAPMVGADADDTAMAITTLNLLGLPTSADAMVKEFEAPTHFRTYSLERDPSLSANCNVLNALLHVPNPESYISQIEKCARFLCEQWWNMQRRLEDKWNLTEQYPTMLLVQALVRLMYLWEQDKLPGLKEDVLGDRVIIVLYQALIHTLQTQQSDGAWASGGHEATSYAIIALAHLSSLPFAQPIRPEIYHAVARGRDFLSTKPASAATEHLWIEKVTYGSPSLAAAYSLAALHISTPTYLLTLRTSGLAPYHPKAVAKFTEFFARLPLYAQTPKWRLSAAVIEGYLFLPLVKRRRLAVFPRQNMDEDKYLEYIPFTWTGANNRDNTFVNADYLYEMMILSMLTYQADEYMEAVVGRYYAGERGQVEEMIERVFETLDEDVDEEGSENVVDVVSPKDNGVLEETAEAPEEVVVPVNVDITETAAPEEEHVNKVEASTDVPVTAGESHIDLGIPEQTAEQTVAVDQPVEEEEQVLPVEAPDTVSEETPSEHDEIKSTDSGYDSLSASRHGKDLSIPDEVEEVTAIIPSLDAVSRPLRKFITHVLRHPKVLSSSAYDQLRLKRELKTYLLAHLTQCTDNARFARQTLPADRSVPFATAASSYHAWVQSTSSDHTSCPFAYAFVSCLLSPHDSTSDCFVSAHEKYLSEDMCRHLAVTCRQYNDYGSLARDRDEKNINSVNFPEFFWRAEESTSDQALKDELYEIAMYDKMKLDLALGQLEARLQSRKGGAALAEAVRMFVNVTDTYGQIYILRDIASRM